MEVIHNINNFFKILKEEMFENYIITYGYYDKSNKKSIILYNYDTIFYFFYIFIYSLFSETFLKNNCINTDNSYSLYFLQNKNKDIVPFGVYYKNGKKQGFIGSIDNSNSCTKNKVLYAIANDINFSYQFELFFNSLKRNNTITYEDIVIIFSSLMFINYIEFNEIKVFFIDKYQENIYKKNDIIKIYD